MCIGMPLQVVVNKGHLAWCEAGAGDTLQRECLDMALVGPQPVGTWVLAFQGAARKVLSNTEATQALAARQALAAVLHSPSSADINHFFADLVGRTPELPAHLRPMPITAAATFTVTATATATAAALQP